MTSLRKRLYCHIPQYYTWDTTNKRWNRRKRGSPVQDGIFKAACLGRLYTVNPKQAECYILRVLLHHISRPTSFADLKTTADRVCNIYREACILLGLTEDDDYLHKAFQEAAESQTPNQLRKLFAIIITCYEDGNPMDLWTRHKEHIVDIARDIDHNYATMYPCQHQTGQVPRQKTMIIPVKRTSMLMSRKRALPIGSHF